MHIINTCTYTSRRCLVESWMIQKEPSVLNRELDHFLLCKSHSLITHDFHAPPFRTINLLKASISFYVLKIMHFYFSHTLFYLIHLCHCLHHCHFLGLPHFTTSINSNSPYVNHTTEEGSSVPPKCFGVFKKSYWLVNSSHNSSYSMIYSLYNFIQQCELVY